MRTVHHSGVSLILVVVMFALLGGGILGAAGQDLPSILAAILEASPRPSSAILASLHGGDTRLILNAARSRMAVHVTDGSLEARFGLVLPMESYEIEVHNRVVDTIEAPFIPSIRSSRLLSGNRGLTCQPEPFPSGTWDITEISPRQDRYGPYMIRTNAVGRVAVYSPGSSEGSFDFMGRYEDTGYGIHANTVPFEYSKSFGCIVARSEDVARLARSLQADRQRDPEAEQVISIPRHGRGR